MKKGLKSIVTQLGTGSRSRSAGELQRLLWIWECGCTHLEERVQDYFCYTAFIDVSALEENLSSPFSYPSRNDKSTAPATMLL